MTSFDFVIGAGAVCGILMVLGSIYLLRTGAITLSDISGSTDKPALELAYREVKLGTRYPAIALFVVGLIFVLGSAWLAKPESASIPIAIKITASPNLNLSGSKARIFVGDEAPINIAGETKYMYTHHVTPSNISGTIYIPGVAPIEQLFHFEDGVWRINLDLRGVADSLPNKPPPGDRKIAPLE